MATCWAKRPELFLYTKGSDVYLWRCNETTLLPMITEDFDDLGKVVDHYDLIGGKDSLLEWEKASYIDLVAYISPRRLLVNSRGLVIAELGKFGQDGKMDKSDQLPFYIRSLDVLSLKPFGLRDRTIPLRTVRYLEADGRAAPVENSTTTTSTSTEIDERKRAGIEKQVAELKDANKTLKNDKEAAEKQVVELKEGNKSLESDKEAAENQVTKLKERNKTLESVKEAAEKQANDLKDKNKSLAEDVAAQKTSAGKAQQERDEAKRDKEAAERKAADLQTQLDSLAINEKKEVWMSTLSDQFNRWNPIELLRVEFFPIVVYDNQGDEYDDLSTNVRSIYMSSARLADHNNVPFENLRGIGPGGYDGGYMVVRLDDLIPSKEKARFDIRDWSRSTCNGEMYAIKEIYPYNENKYPIKSNKVKMTC